MNHHRLFVLVFLLLSASISLESICRGADDNKPNVLILIVDDLNDWVGCMDGHPQTHTPNMDRLAARGTLFTNAHCQAPICGPSRASLLSGFYPHTTGVYQQPTGPGTISDKNFFNGHMLPQYFAKHGYETLGVGKIAHQYKLNKLFNQSGSKGSSGPKPPNEKRFNYFLPDVPYSGTQTDWGAFPERDEEMPDHQTADWAVKRLQEKREKPFFLAVGFHRPHVPFYVPEKWFNKIKRPIELPKVRLDDFDDIPPIGKAIHELPKYPMLKFLQANDNEQFTKCVHAYLACIAFVDHQVGRVLDALEKSPHAKNTHVVLISDHGYHLGEKDRVSKHSLWEESARVPFIIASPGSKAQKCGKPIGLIDLYPTLLELCDLPAKKSNEGKSLLPLIKNPESSDWRFSIITTYPRGSHALRSKRYRYIRYEDGTEELYDHDVDPYEWKNLAGESEHAKLIKRFRSELPENDAPYHRITSPKPINAWFKKHLTKHGIKPTTSKKK